MRAPGTAVQLIAVSSPDRRGRDDQVRFGVHYQAWPTAWVT
jgi:hypothetical protein